MFILEIDEESHGLGFLQYWIALFVPMVWLPFVIMVASVVLLYLKLKHSEKAFSNLSLSSKISRTRGKINGLLLLLIVIELLCYSPWISWIFFQYNYWNNYLDNPEDIPDVISF